MERMMKSSGWLLAGCLLLAGCGSGQEAAMPVFVGGTNYGVVATNVMMDGVPRSGILSLYYFPEGPKGPRTLVWPCLIAEDSAVFGKLIVFNGGISDEMVWKYYPALFAYNGEGHVVEISQPACRRIEGWKPDWNNYAFAILGASNDTLRLDASQRLPVDPDRPKRLMAEINVADVLQSLQQAQTNTNPLNYGGVTYYVSP